MDVYGVAAASAKARDVKYRLTNLHCLLGP